MPTYLDRVDYRSRLKPRRDPYWQRLSEGRYVGFRLMPAPKRPNQKQEGTWLARAYNGAGYEHRALGDFANLPLKERFDAAKRAGEEYFTHLDFGGDARSCTVRTACDDYVQHLRVENSDGAAKDAEGRFRRLVANDAIAKVNLAKLTARQVASWKKRVIEAGGSKSSYNRNATALRAALNLALKRRMVSSDHAWVHELVPYKDADGRRDLYLTREQRRKLIESASEELRPFVRALALLPLRPGDVAALTVGDFNARHGILAVPAGKTRSRKIPLSGDALAHVKAAAKGKLPGAWLFSRLDGKKWDRFAWRDAIKDAAAAAKLPEAVCAYTLRHSAITDLVSSDLDLFHVAQLAGTSIVMIEKHYGHLRRKQVRHGMKVLNL